MCPSEAFNVNNCQSGRKNVHVFIITGGEVDEFCFRLLVFFFVCVLLVHAHLCKHILVYATTIPQNLSVCNAKRSWMFIEPFDILSAAFYWGILVPASYVFYITCNLLSYRGLKCRLLNVAECSVVLLLDIALSLCFSVKAPKPLGNQYCNRLIT